MADAPSSPRVTRADVETARRRIGDSVEYTPLTKSRTLSDITGTEVWLKFENLQYTGSFKERGARNRLLDIEPGTGVIAMSAGNHAQGVAYHGALLGLETTIVMPENTPFMKIARTRDLGATVEVAGADVSESAEVAHALAIERGLEFIHPFDDAAVIAGQGTIALEMIEQNPDLDLIVAAVGGGGLAAGLVTATADESVQVIGVQTERYPYMADLIESRPISAIPGSTVADGIAVTEPGGMTSQVLLENQTEMLVVTEARIEESIAMLLEIEKTVVEGAGAVALAACIEYPDVFAGKKAGLVLCGGNIDPRTLAVVTLRGLAVQGRLNRLRVELDDIPGRLALVSNLVAEAGANVVQVDHDGLGSTGARSTLLELRIDTLDREHAERVLHRLLEYGLAADLADW